MHSAKQSSKVMNIALLFWVESKVSPRKRLFSQSSYFYIILTRSKRMSAFLSYLILNTTNEMIAIIDVLCHLRSVLKF